MSRLPFFLLAVLLALPAVLPAPADDDDDDDFEGIDVDQILSNKRLLDSHIKCYLDKGPCTPLIKKAKKKLPEVITTSCSKCSSSQVYKVKKAMGKVKETRAKEYQAILDKYAPAKQTQQQFNEWLAKAA